MAISSMEKNSENNLDSEEIEKSILEFDEMMK
jgi:hypothetical protein